MYVGVIDACIHVIHALLRARVMFRVRVTVRVRVRVTIRVTVRQEGHSTGEYCKCCVTVLGDVLLTCSRTSIAYRTHAFMAHRVRISCR